MHRKNVKVIIVIYWSILHRVQGLCETIPFCSAPVFWIKELESDINELQSQ